MRLVVDKVALRQVLYPSTYVILCPIMLLLLEGQKAKPGKLQKAVLFGKRGTLRKKNIFTSSSLQMVQVLCSTLKIATS
jgi:Na+/H+-translocating membrane pyrophosphatase